MAPQRRGVVPMLPPLLLLVLSMSWCCGGGGAAARPAPSSSSPDSVPGFVRSWCAATEYPALCDATLAPYAAAVGSSPARLSWAALTAARGGARAATAAVKAVAAAGHLAPAAAEAARDCVSMLGGAEDLLRQSAEAMARLGKEERRRGGQAASSRRDARFEVGSVQAWASAALTDGDMCVEGFRAEAAGGGGVREAVRGHVVGVVHLTANALGIVNAMAKKMP
jgi:pectinesterase inhibitor-like protein